MTIVDALDASAQSSRSTVLAKRVRIGGSHRRIARAAASGSRTGLDDVVLAFGIRWLDFGGATAEEIFVTFGWTESRYFQRLCAVSASRFAPIDDALRQRLHAVCSARLQQLDMTRAHPERKSTTMSVNQVNKEVRPTVAPPSAPVASELTVADVACVVEALTGIRPRPALGGVRAAKSAPAFVRPPLTADPSPREEQQTA